MRMTWCLVVVSLVGCSDDRWERTRAEYCAELAPTKKLVQEAASAARGHLAAAKAAEEKAMGQGNYTLAGAADGRAILCGKALLELGQAGSYVSGFDRSTHLIARGRKEGEGVEASGFVLNSPAEPITSGDTDVFYSCTSLKWNEAEKELAGIEAEFAKRIDAKIAQCKASGVAVSNAR